MSNREADILQKLNKIYDKRVAAQKSGEFYNLTESEKIYWEARTQGLLDAILLIKFGFDETILQ